MRVIYQYDFNLENIWPADYATSPYMRDGSIYYAYNDKKNGIRMIKIEKGGQVSRMWLCIIKAVGNINVYHKTVKFYGKKNIRDTVIHLLK